ncbi:uncharacterized protein LOC143917182 [Arctopsyche grandis]|uniref:uncharacterized protein LOC143917182 n=1 Tax=Arctopsyche grandis TaxID=121162 RepID=UPI00406D8055
MAEKKEIMQKIKQQEIELEKTLSSLSIKEYDEDLKRKLAVKKHIRQEIDLFNKHLYEVKSNLDIQSKSDEVYFENIARKQLEDEEYHRNMFHLKRKELLQVFLSIYFLFFVIKLMYTYYIFSCLYFYIFCY